MNPVTAGLAAIVVALLKPYAAMGWKRSPRALEKKGARKAMAERLVQAGGRMEIGDGQAGSSDQELQGVPRRSVAERTFKWLSRNRRLAKDYERRVQTSEPLIEIAIICLLLRRLGRAA